MTHDAEAPQPEQHPRIVVQVDKARLSIEQLGNGVYEYRLSGVTLLPQDGSDSQEPITNKFEFQYRDNRAPDWAKQMLHFEAQEIAEEAARAKQSG